jgi:hypothetical protein
MEKKEKENQKFKVILEENAKELKRFQKLLKEKNYF